MTQYRPYDRGHHDLLRQDSMLPHIRAVDILEWENGIQTIKQQEQTYFEIQEMVLSYHEGELESMSPYRDIAIAFRANDVFDGWLAYQGVTQVMRANYYKHLIMWRTTFTLKGMSEEAKAIMLLELQKHKDDGKIERIEDETSEEGSVCKNTG